VKKKVAPWRGLDSTQMRPPWRSTIFLQMARPMPEGIESGVIEPAPTVWKDRRKSWDGKVLSLDPTRFF
jgi:hypothetical protein